MKIGKFSTIASIALFGVLLAFAAIAAVSVDDGPASLVPDPILAPASSGQIGLFEVTLSQDAGETLSGVTVTINDNGASGVSGADFASVSVYKDDGDGMFDSAVDLLSGTNASVNVGATTTVATAANNAIDGGKFFVSLATSGSWSDVSPDSVTVRLESNGIETSGGVVATTEAETNTITADTTSPTFDSAEAKNTGGTDVKEAGDSVDLTFSEATNKVSIDETNVDSIFMLDNGHSFLDGDGMLGNAAWNVEGTVLTITLSNSSTTTSTLPTVEPGDVVTISGSDIEDLAGNVASGARSINGDFVSELEDEDEEEEGDGQKNKCGNDLRNGRLYKVTGVEDQTVYLAAACRLKPFRGAAVFHARGHKFQNIIELESLENITIKDKPVLPAAGTLIKGSDATVWFVTKNGRRRGFRTAAKFFALGFNFGQVETISDEDLGITLIDPPIGANESHPDGALVKCGNSATVFQIIGNKRFPFKSANAFQSRGHAFGHIANIECGSFGYVNGAPIE